MGVSIPHFSIGRSLRQIALLKLLNERRQKSELKSRPRWLFPTTSKPCLRRPALAVSCRPAVTSCFGNGQRPLRATGAD
jgi:hypothetical protein